MKENNVTVDNLHYSTLLLEKKQKNLVKLIQNLSIIWNLKESEDPDQLKTKIMDLELVQFLTLGNLTVYYTFICFGTFHLFQRRIRRL